jgi:hypothetical protein
MMAVIEVSDWRGSRQFLRITSIAQFKQPTRWLVRAVIFRFQFSVFTRGGNRVNVGRFFVRLAASLIRLPRGLSPDHVSAKAEPPSG